MPKCAKCNCTIKKDFSTCNSCNKTYHPGCAHAYLRSKSARGVLPSVVIEFVPEIKPHDNDRTGLQCGQWFAIRPPDTAFPIFGRVDFATTTSAGSGSFGGEHVLWAALTSGGSVNFAERVLSVATASAGSNSLR